MKLVVAQILVQSAVTLSMGKRIVKSGLVFIFLNVHVTSWEYGFVSFPVEGMNLT